VPTVANPAAAHAAEPVPQDAHPVADQAGDALREEMLPFFLVEASVWRDQIATALLEWEAASSGPRAEALRQTIRAAVTNLGGSAATIGLTAIERLAFALLSELGGPGPHGSAPHETFAQLDAALRALAAPLGPEPAPATAELYNLAAVLGDLEESRAHAAPRIRDGLHALSAQLRHSSDQGGRGGRDCHSAAAGGARSARRTRPDGNAERPAGDRAPARPPDGGRGGIGNRGYNLARGVPDALDRSRGGGRLLRPAIVPV
jgi:hypothetical protein